MDGPERRGDLTLGSQCIFAEWLLPSVEFPSCSAPSDAGEGTAERGWEALLSRQLPDDRGKPQAWLVPGAHPLPPRALRGRRH